MNFRAVLALPKTAGSAQTHKSMSFIWIVWSTWYIHITLPLPPYHQHSSKMLMKGIFDPYVLWPFDHRHMGTPLPPKTCWCLKWMVPNLIMSHAEILLIFTLSSENSKTHVCCLGAPLFLMVRRGSFFCSCPIVRVSRGPHISWSLGRRIAFVILTRVWLSWGSRIEQWGQSFFKVVF